jgi:ParB/RepB/Spo0J family partition protein
MAHIRLAWEMVKPGRRLIAICSEGPFFREDSKAVAFRAWLKEIKADANKLPADTFRASGTGVAARIIFATKAGTAEPLPPAPERDIRDIPMDQVEPDPEQPRKVFEPIALRELARTIRHDGLLQPIEVRPVGPDRYRITFGERRWRAHQINRAATIRAYVTEEAVNLTDTRVRQIVENDQRQDVTPLEQARSYQGLMDESGWTPEELGARIGKAAHRITERTVLLKLEPDYQGLLASGNLTPSEAFELTRLGPRGQRVLFEAIRTGGCKKYQDLRATSLALVQAEAQFDLMPDAPPGPTELERQQASAFESNVDRISALLRSGIHENQIVAVRKTNPHRAGILADLLAVMQTDLRRIEVALREAAIQTSFLDAA